MYLKKIWVCLFILSITLQANSQIIRINPEDGLLADQLAEEHPEDDYVSLSTKETYTFPYSTKDQELFSLMTYDETILSLKENKSFIKYEFADDKTSLLNLRATNYKKKTIPTYGSLRTVKYTSSGIFHDDLETANIVFNFSTRGDRINYSYEKKISDIRYLTKAYFHTSYLCQEKSISFVIPSWLDIEFVEQNFDGYDIIKSESTEVVKRQGHKVITYTLKNIKGVKNEAYSAGYSLSLPHIIILAKKYSYNDKSHELFSTTADLYKWYSSLVTDVYKDNSSYKSIVESLTKDAKTDKEKVENIFYWVQDNIRYIAFEDGIMGFKPASDDDVFTKKYGDCKGMANLLCQMLKTAGYDARLTWLGTRRIPYSYDIPSLAVDNHMITTLILDGERYFLDGTEKGVSFKDYAHRIQGQDVMIQDGENYIIDTVPEFDHKHNAAKASLELSLKENILVGKGTQEFNGEEKNRLYRDFKYVTKTEQDVVTEKYLSNSNKNITLSNLESKGLENRNQKIEFNYDIEISNKVTEAGGELYINIEKDYDFANLEIEKPEERVTDLNLGSKINIEKTTTLTIPENLKVDYTPEDININNDDFSIIITFKIKGAVIEYNKSINVKNGLIHVKNIDEWNKAIKKLNSTYKDQIVLIK